MSQGRAPRQYILSALLESPLPLKYRQKSSGAPAVFQLTSVPRLSRSQVLKLPKQISYNSPHIDTNSPGLKLHGTRLQLRSPNARIAKDKK